MTFFRLTARLWQTIYGRHNAFLVTLLLFIIFRLMAVLLLRPGGFIADFSDFDFYYTMGQMNARGYRPNLDLVTAYPPLFPALVDWVYHLSSRLPPWSDPRLFFNVTLSSILLLFEAGTLVLIYRLWCRLRDEEGPDPVVGQGKPIPAPILYALLFTPAYTMLGWLEAMPLFFALLGLDLLLSTRGRRPTWLLAAPAAALGFLTKLTPALLLPIAARRLGWRLSLPAARQEWFNPRSPGNIYRPLLLALLFAGCVFLFGFPFVADNPAMGLSSFRVMELRPPWQSIWALLDGYTGFGMVPFDGRNPGALAGEGWVSRLPWGVISAGFLLVYLWAYTRDFDWRRTRIVLTFTAFSVLWLFLYSKGWSPQFLLWVAAFLVLLMPTLRGMVILGALTLLNFVEGTVYFIMLPEQTWLLWGTVLLRTAALLGLCMELLGSIWPPARLGRWLRDAGRLLSLLFLAGCLAGGLLALPRAADAYWERRLAAHPCPGLVERLQEEAGSPAAGIATAEIDLWRWLYPWLQEEYDFVVLDDYGGPEYSRARAAERLAGLAGPRPAEFWWVAGAKIVGDELAAAYFEDAGVHVGEEGHFGACRLTRVLVLPAEPAARLDALGGPILLQAYQLAPTRAGMALHLTLYWIAPAGVDADYTVFTQLFDPAGMMVAQQDNPPQAGLAPTSTWTPGAIIRDPYRLELPTGLQGGTYRLLVGMYTSEGRLMLEPTAGGLADHLVIPVQVAP